MARKKTLGEVITGFRNKHGVDRYDYSLVNYINGTTKVIIICPIHDTRFEQTPTCHLSGCGCPDCASESNKKTTEDYVIDFENKHGKGTYDYSLFVNNGALKKSIIICPIHNNQFLMTPSVHLHGGSGCPDCASERQTLLQTKTTEQCIIDFENKHGKGTYDYSLFVNNGVMKKSIIVCPIHQKQFLMTPSNHLQGGGCPSCARESKLKTTKDCIIDFENKHGKGRYDYSLFVNNGSTNKSIIICPIHNKQFKQTPANHLQGNGCPLCKESKGEKSIRLWLTENNISHLTQYSPMIENKLLRFDFWLLEQQLLIEFDGIQHYKPIDRFGGQVAFDAGQLRDQQKTEWAISNNIKLLRIKHTQIKNIPEILTRELL